MQNFQPLPNSDMPDNQISKHLPIAAVREFEKIEQADWSEGVPLHELLLRVHRVLELFLPEEGKPDKAAMRVKRSYTPRSFRHYQTSGCIDPPERRGNEVFYAFRHFVQALLVRKLLWEQVPTGRIALLIAGRSTDDTKRMFMEGVEMVAVGGAVQSGAEISPAPGAVEMWRHIVVAPGIQILLHSELSKPRPTEVRDWLTRIEAVLRKEL